jgi:hypothetical protein
MRGLVAGAFCGDANIVGALQIQPELGGGAKPVAQPQRRVAGNSALTMDDLREQCSFLG